MKQKILTFTNKISRHLSKLDRKFTTDITYGMLASKSCFLTDMADHLHEDLTKINISYNFSRHLKKRTPTQAFISYLQMLKKWVPSKLVIQSVSQYGHLSTYRTGATLFELCHL